MFRRLQWKLVAMFAAAVMIIMTVVGTFMLGSVISNNQDSFLDRMERVVAGDFSDTLKDTLVSGTATPQELGKIIDVYSGQLGLGTDRKCYILSAEGKVISAENVGVEKTPNIISAMSGQTGTKFQINAGYMDYAYLLNVGNRNYIIYIRDSGRALNELVRSMVDIVLKAILFAILASIFLCYFLARTITSPLSVLTEKAEDFAAGKFDSNLEHTSDDEIGTLIETFNYMGGVMRNALSEIEGEKHKIEVILEQVSSGIVAFNDEQKIIHINRAGKNLLRIRDTEKVSFDEFFKKLGLDVTMAEFMYLKKNRTEHRELELNKKKLNLTFAPFRIDEEKVKGVVCVLEDRTEEFRLEESRKKFVAEVSHELKTPLTTISTYTETILDGDDDMDTVKSLVGTVHKEAEKMTNLVKNLLTLSKYDAKAVDLELELFYLDELARDVVKTYKIEAEKKNIDILFNLTSDSPRVNADRFMIERVIRNIISNAVKYTNEGGTIKVYAGYIYNEAYIKVEDNGIGIPEEDVKHIFDRFYRVDKARSRALGGTGLGLSIAKEIMERHGGSITAESKVGEFTRMTIKIPMNIEGKEE